MIGVNTRLKVPIVFVKKGNYPCGLENLLMDQNQYAIETRVLYRDEKILIADKPAGIPVHATPDPDRENFTDLLQKTFKLPYIRTANRLDLETSGVVVFGLDPTFNEGLDKILFQSTKKYHLWVFGKFPQKTMRIESFLKDGKGKVKTVFAGGKKAITHFSLLSIHSSQKSSCLEATLLTGRRHQIRIQIAEAGFPILGDKVYGTSHSIKMANRCLLHSYQISMNLSYQENKEITIIAPLPQDFHF
jgi:RluA family pseudouridine synthase